MSSGGIQEASALDRAVLTSLDTQGSFGTHPYADEFWVHSCREGVADKLEPEWPTRATAMRNCGKAGVAMACRGCGTTYVFPSRCGARTCPVCARKAAAAIVDRLLARVAVHDIIMETEPWDGPGSREPRRWKHVVLTLRARQDIEQRFSPQLLRREVKRARAAWRRFWRRTSWGLQRRDPGARQKRSRRDTSYIVAIEVSPSGMVHLHVLVYGEFVPQRRIQAIWSDVVGELAIVRINAIDTTADIGGALREVLKYAIKGEKGVRDHFGRAASVELAFRNVKRVSIGGALRSIKVDEHDRATSDDTRPEDLHDQRKALCENCGLVGEFYWLGSVTQEDVAGNGGFGRFTADRACTDPGGLTFGIPSSDVTRSLTYALTARDPTLTREQLHAYSEEPPSPLGGSQASQATYQGLRHEY